MAAGLSLLFTAFAYFEDTEASSVNRFQAGTWSLSVDGEGSDPALTFQDLIANDSSSENWTVTNTGTIPAYVDLTIVVSESGMAHLGDNLTAHLYVSGGGDIYREGPINDAGGSYNLNLPLSPGGSAVIVLDWKVSDDYLVPDPADKVVFTISFSISPAP